MVLAFWDVWGQAEKGSSWIWSLRWPKPCATLGLPERAVSSQMGVKGGGIETWNSDGS